MKPGFPKLILLLSDLGFLVGPLFYFYVRSLLEPNFSLKKNDWRHLLPFLLSLICSAIIFVLSPKFQIWRYPGRIFFSGLVLVQTVAYVIASFMALRAQGVPLTSFLSYIDNSRLAWVRFLMGGYVVLWLLQLQLFIGWDVLAQPAWCPYGISLYLVAAFLFFNGIVYIGLKRPEIFHQTPKYQYSVLTQDNKDLYREKLLSLMGNDKLYLEPSLTLPELAQKIGVAPCHLSQIINESFGHNFRDFVNKYRIEESKSLLAQQDQMHSILGIAFDAGFNSKSAFNNAFKKHTGVTPKEFKRKAPVLVA